jgi:hypothetical protein
MRLLQQERLHPQLRQWQALVMMIGWLEQQL